MFFIIFCLIFRTAYQGKKSLTIELHCDFIFLGVFFEMMTTDMRKSEVKSVEEIFENNFTVVIYDRPYEHECYRNTFQIGMR